MISLYLGFSLALLCILSQSCAVPSPTVYVAELSPDTTKLGYIEEYFPGLMHYPVPVYPKYKLAVRVGHQDCVLYSIEAKELMIRFAIVAWSQDSTTLLFTISSVNAIAIKKAFDTISWKEIPFEKVESVARKIVHHRWGKFLLPGEDPLEAIKQPSDNLAIAFNKWRLKKFGFALASLECCQ